MGILIGIDAAVAADEGIKLYYIKYDVKSSNNTIVDANLLMIPSTNEFRTKQFFRITTTGRVPAVPGESNISIAQRIRDDALKKILTDKGLKSIKTKDLDVVVSYEGVFLAPFRIDKNIYREKEESRFYEAQINFSPIAFPDEWKKLNLKHKVKNIVSDFFLLFK